MGMDSCFDTNTPVWKFYLILFCCIDFSVSWTFNLIPIFPFEFFEGTDNCLRKNTTEKLSPYFYRKIMKKIEPYLFLRKQNIYGSKGLFHFK